MRVKYFYQQFGSHVSVIVIAILVLSLLFTQFVERFMYENKMDELTAYGKSILTDLENSNSNSQQVLREYGNVLSGRDIHFSLFDEKSVIIYTVDGKHPDITLQDEEWKKITQGETVTVKKDFKRFAEGATFVLLPYVHNGHFVGGILLAAPIEGISNVISTINQYLFYTVLISLIVSLLLSWLLAKVHVKRLNRIKAATSQVAQGDYHIQIPATDFDEIGELANDFNNMVKRLRISMEEIEALENRRRQFMADVSHELRTPLTTINGIIEGIMNEMIPESEKTKGMQLASKETKRLIRLVNENLDYEKIRSNQVILHKEAIRLLDVFEIVKDQLDIVALEKNNVINIEASGTIIVHADYDRIIQILINIVKNSIQFTEDGNIYLRGKDGKESTIIEVEDTGMGMNPSEIKKIWQRFYKSELSRSNQLYGEFGLGLSIVKQLVTLHGGKIDVSSEEGKGTLFTIDLPKQCSKKI